MNDWLVLSNQLAIMQALRILIGENAQLTAQIRMTETELATLVEEADDRVGS